MINKRLIPCLYLESGRAVTGFGQRNLFGNGDVEALAGFYSGNGADELLVFDFSSGDEEHEKAISRIREICAASEIPVMAAGNINRTEDVKKLIYAGCARVALNFSKQSNIELLEGMSKRFGQERMYVCISSPEEFTENKNLIENYAGGILALDMVQNEVEKVSSMQVILHTEENHEKALVDLMKQKAVGGLSGAFVSAVDTDLTVFKELCKKEKIPMNICERAISWFKPPIKKEYDDVNPLRVFQQVYDMILYKKEHLEEGSYTGCLFDEGLDEILKKTGEKCAEIIIAAKNPDKDELKYEISDFLYYIMVLMAEKGVNWEEILQVFLGELEEFYKK